MKKIVWKHRLLGYGGGLKLSGCSGMEEVRSIGSKKFYADKINSEFLKNLF
jgi:hypothetical protein